MPAPMTRVRQTCTWPPAAIGRPRHPGGVGHGLLDGEQARQVRRDLPDDATVVLGEPGALVRQATERRRGTGARANRRDGWASATPDTATLGLEHERGQPREPRRQARPAGEDELGKSVAISPDGTTIVAGRRQQDEGTDDADVDRGRRVRIRRAGERRLGQCKSRRRADRPGTGASSVEGIGGAWRSSTPACSSAITSTEMTPGQCTSSIEPAGGWTSSTPPRPSTRTARWPPMPANSTSGAESQATLRPGIVGSDAGTTVPGRGIHLHVPRAERRYRGDLFDVRQRRRRHTAEVLDDRLARQPGELLVCVDRER